MKRPRIAVIGAGITGMTTALLLQERGYATIIYAALSVLDDIDPCFYPHFSSLFPPAAILPHTVQTEDLLRLFALSQAEFEKLSNVPESGVRWQEHYEISARGKWSAPPYLNLLNDCEPFGTGKNHLRFEKILRLNLAGWTARILFAEMPLYARYLFRRYLDSGGSIRRKQLTTADIGSVREEIIINCSGLGARELFRDLSVHPIRGYLLFVPGLPFPPMAGGRIFSYNYTPPPDVYQFDVYCFPRIGDIHGAGRGWLLGGSREFPIAGADGRWHFPDLGCGMSQGFPDPILHLNRSILLGLTGTDISTFPHRSSFGFRPGRDGGVRIQAAGFAGRQIIHNYGHGGAGVALSWGSAFKVAGILDEIV